MKPTLLDEEERVCAEEEGCSSGGREVEGGKKQGTGRRAAGGVRVISSMTPRSQLLLAV